MLGCYMPFYIFDRTFRNKIQFEERVSNVANTLEILINLYESCYSTLLETIRPARVGYLYPI